MYLYIIPISKRRTNSNIVRPDKEINFFYDNKNPLIRIFKLDFHYLNINTYKIGFI